MYRSSKTQIITQKGGTEHFPKEVDVRTENIENDPPWAMMFPEDLVLCVMTHEEVEEDLETWRVVFERHGLNINRTKTEYLLSPTNDTEATVKIVDA